MKYSSLLLVIPCVLASQRALAAPPNDGLKQPKTVSNEMHRFRWGFAYERGYTYQSNSLLTDTSDFNTAGPSLLLECGFLCWGQRWDQPFVLGFYAGWRASHSARELDGDANGVATLFWNEARLGVSFALRPQGLNWFWFSFYLGASGAFVDARMSQESTFPDDSTSHFETREHGWAWCGDGSLRVGVDAAVGSEFWQRLGPYVEANGTGPCTDLKLSGSLSPPVVVDLGTVRLAAGLMMSF